MDRPLRVAEVAEQLGVCNATVYRLCERGDLIRELATVYPGPNMKNEMTTTMAVRSAISVALLVGLITAVAPGCSETRSGEPQQTRFSAWVSKAEEFAKKAAHEAATAAKEGESALRGAGAEASDTAARVARAAAAKAAEAADRAEEVAREAADDAKKGADDAAAAAARGAARAAKAARESASKAAEWAGKAERAAEERAKSSVKK